MRLKPRHWLEVMMALTVLAGMLGSCSFVLGEVEESSQASAGAAGAAAGAGGETAAGGTIATGGGFGGSHYCSEYWADCDENPANGCETNVSTLEHCRECTTSCPPVSAPNTTQRCSLLDGCVVECDGNFLDCDDDMTTTGCEVQGGTETDCSFCGQACPAPLDCRVAWGSLVCACTENEDCNAGSTGTCVPQSVPGDGVCLCTDAGPACAEGERCGPGGECV